MATRVCPRCGESNSSGNRYCNGCGAPVADVTAPAGRASVAGEGARGLPYGTGATARPSAAGGHHLRRWRAVIPMVLVVAGAVYLTMLLSGPPRLSDVVVQLPDLPDGFVLVSAEGEDELYPGDAPAGLADVYGVEYVLNSAHLGPAAQELYCIVYRWKGGKDLVPSYLSDLLLSNAQYFYWLMLEQVDMDEVRVLSGGGGFDPGLMCVDDGPPTETRLIVWDGDYVVDIVWIERVASTDLDLRALGWEVTKRIHRIH
jgi:hypothetical protein